MRKVIKNIPGTCYVIGDILTEDQFGWASDDVNAPIVSFEEIESLTKEI